MAEVAFNQKDVLSQLEKAAQQGHVTPQAAENIRRWLTEPRYQPYAGQVAEHITAGKWKELDDVFWTIIPFGTGGRRGRMYPIGTNAINDRTIGESAQGLATYVRQQAGDGGNLSCAIAYDTRHNSRHFAELCASIMVANGFRVFFLEDYRSTPELSFLVRARNCTCGIMVTASHNPPSDNAVKVYWSSGVQVLPPHDRETIQHVMQVDEIKRVDFQQAVKNGQVVFCKAEIDREYVAAVLGQRYEGPRDLEVLYSPLHGVGAASVVEVLREDGFQKVHVYEPHQEPNGDFPNVPGHVSNPENPAVFTAIIEQARTIGADVVLTTDPDCDRMGCAAPLTRDIGGEWATFTGNQLGALLVDFVLGQRKRQGRLSKDDYVVKTLVTTEMIRRIADSYGVRTFGNLHVGFKWIGGLMDEVGPEHFVLGTEESHGYLAGQYARDKDGALACMLLCELAALVKSEGKSLHEQLDSLYWQHGYHAERLLNVTMKGSEGMARMEALMARLRSQPPRSLAGLEVVAARDYQNRKMTRPGGKTESLDAPQGNMVILDLAEEGNYIAVRPSGTEPKVKFYMFTYVPAEQLADLEDTRQEMVRRLDQFEQDLQRMADEV